MPSSFKPLDPRANDADPAHVPPPVNTSPGAEYGDDPRLFQGIPGIERVPHPGGNGRLWAIWYAGGLLYFALYARRRLVVSPEEAFALEARQAELSEE